jgi:hypothetical protein
MSGFPIRNYSSATAVHYHNGFAYDADGALLVSQGYCIGQQYTGWTRSSTNGVGTNDTDFQTLVTLTIPSGVMGLHSKLVIVADWDVPTLSAGTKTLQMDFGGNNISSPTFASGVNSHTNMKAMVEIQNLGSLTSQKISNAITYSTTGNARIATSVNTATDVSLIFKCKWSANIASETITLIGYSVWHYPGL